MFCPLHSRFHSTYHPGGSFLFLSSPGRIGVYLVSDEGPCLLVCAGCYREVSTCNSRAHNGLMSLTLSYSTEKDICWDCKPELSLLPLRCESSTPQEVITMGAQRRVTWVPLPLQLTPLSCLLFPLQFKGRKDSRDAGPPTRITYPMGLHCSCFLAPVHTSVQGCS